MTFLALQQSVYDRCGHQQSPPTEVSRRIKAFLNRWNRKILSAKGMEPLRRVTITKASVADQSTYGIALQKIRYVFEATNQRRIWEKTLAWYADNFPDPTQFGGTPTDWVPMGLSRIHTRPSAACELFIVSTEAADTGSVLVTATRSNGYSVSLSKALTGTAPVSMSSTITDVIDISDVRLSAAQTGSVTVTQGSGGTELSKMVIGQTAPRFLRYALAPTPAAAITYSIIGIAPLVDMTNDTDEPFEDADFHDILVDGAVHDEWNSRGRAQEARSLSNDIEDRIRELRLSILEWPESDDDRIRSFEDTIHLPIV